MTDFFIPQSEADRPNSGGGQDIFPEGVWQGTLEQLRVRTITPGEPGDFLLPDGADVGTVASLDLAENTAVLEGQPNIGAMHYFDDGLVLGYSVNGTEYRWDRPQEGEHWRVQQTRRRLVNLAKALGEVETAGENIGPTERFVDAVNNGAGENFEFAGTRLNFEISHGSKKRPDGTMSRWATTETYEPAV